MEIVQLRIVKEIHLAGSLSKASMRVNKAQSIVSRHLAAFEKECGGRIFHRNGRGVELTELGQKVMPQIEQVLEAMECMVDVGHSASHEMAGTVRLFVSSALCGWLVPRIYEAVRAEHPQIRLHFYERYSGPIDGALDNGDADVAIYLRNGNAPGANLEAICKYDTYLVSLPGASATQRSDILFSELDGLPLLLPSEPSLQRHALADLATTRGITLNVAAEVNSPVASQALFNAGIGYVVVPIAVGPASRTSAIGEAIQDGRLQASRIRDPDIKRTLVVGTAPGTPPRVDAVRKIAVSILRQANQEEQPVRSIRSA